MKLFSWLLILASPIVMLYPLWNNPVSAGEDDVVYYYPVRQMAGEALRAGRLPVVNPLEGTGGPFLGDPQTAMLLPATWLFAFLPAKTAYALSIYLAFAAAGLGTYLYLRRLGLIEPAAMVGAVAFMFCGFLVAHRVHLSMLQTAAFLPWGLWGIELLRWRVAPALLALTAVGAMSIAAGHWAILLYMAMVWGVYFLFRARPLGRGALIAAAACALAAMLTAPQIAATMEVMRQTTRQAIGLAEAGENSFYPTAVAMMFFPMLMGVRQAGFFPDKYWGPWHHCEMLGYVGLLTLALAGAAVWRLYRKGKAGEEGKDPGCILGTTGPSTGNSYSGLIKLWTWIAVGALLWMPGYYLPTYRVLQMVPLFKMARCPARMLLALDMALAALAAIAVHVAAEGGMADRMRKTIRRAVGLVLPAAMLAVLAGLTIYVRFFSDRGIDFPAFYAGSPKAAAAAIRPSSPAIWVPLGAMLATILAVRFWLHRPRRRSFVLPLVLLADLFVLTRFIDVPADRAATVKPDYSPAAAWLWANDPPADAEGKPCYRIWSLADSYADRPVELLAPAAGQAKGFDTLATYGPWHAPAHAHLLGFDHYGRCRDWEQLLRRNYLLSLYRVRYILTANRQFQDVIESVRLPVGPSAAEGPNLLTGAWEVAETSRQRDVFVMGSPIWWNLSWIKHRVPIEPGAIYRASVQVRCPGGSMPNLLRMELWPTDRVGYLTDTPCLEVATEQVSDQWRTFTRTFRPPPGLPREVFLAVSTCSERYIEVRNVELCRGEWPQPASLGPVLPPGEAVYQKVQEVPAEAGKPPVTIYRNLLALDGFPANLPSATDDEIETLRISPPSVAGQSFKPPSLSVALRNDPLRPLLSVSLPGGLLYFAVAAAYFLRRRKTTTAEQTAGAGRRHE